MFLSKLAKTLLGSGTRNRRTAKPQNRRSRRLALEALEDRCVPAGYFVAPMGSDAAAGTLATPFATIGHALAVAVHSGDIVSVRAGTYHERLSLTHSGVTLQAYANEHPILTNAGSAGGDMILLTDVSNVTVSGFEITANHGVSDGSGIRFLGGGSNITLRNNIIHDMRGTSAMGITIYGTSTTPVSNLVIDHNTIYDCDPADSEALTLNGNVTNFQITNNLVHDVNNIGIDMIGGDTSINATQGARNGLVRGNTVYHARSNYGGGFAAGIYVDGGQNITIEDNISYANDMGIEVGAETRGIVASGIVVRNNLIYGNDKYGLIFGGFDSTVGRVSGCSFVNNVLYKNDTLGGYSQLDIQYASNNTVADNIIYTSADTTQLQSDAGNVNNRLDYNMWYAESGASNVVLTWNGVQYDTFQAYQHATGQDTHSRLNNPRFVNAAAADFHLAATSPAIDTGSPTTGWYAPLAFDNVTRPQGVRPDMGAYEKRAPVLTLPGTPPAYGLGESPVVIAAAATVSEPGVAAFPNGTLTVSIVAGGTTVDRLEIRNQGTATGKVGVSGSQITYGTVVIGTFAGGAGTPLVVQLNAKATPSITQALIRDITFRSPTGGTTGTRTVRFRLTDGAGGVSVPVDKNVQVTGSGFTADQKRRSEQITSVFENDTIVLQYGYVEALGDGRGITAGRAGFTTATGDLLLVVQGYTDKVPGNVLAKFLPRLRQLAQSGSPDVTGLDGFTAAWQQAAADVRFRAAQDGVVDQLYYQPAVGYWQQLELHDALSLAVIYDTIIQHGDGNDPDGLSALIARTKTRAGGSPSTGIAEHTWITTFLQVRREDLAHSYDPATRAAWAASVSRVDVLAQIATSGDWDLHGPIAIGGDVYTHVTIA